MSSSDRPQVRKPYVNYSECDVITPPEHKPKVVASKPPTSKTSKVPKPDPKLSDFGLVMGKNGELKEIADNKKTFRVRITTTGDHEKTYYHLRIVLGGSVYVTPSFWSKRRQSGGIVVKPRPPIEE